MDRLIVFTMFFLIVVTVMALGHRYLYKRVVADLTDNPKIRRIGKWSAFGLFLLTIFAVALSRHTLGTGLGFAVLAGLIWLGFAFYALMLFGLIDLSKLVNRLTRGKKSAESIEDASEEISSAQVDASRRQFLARGGAIATLASSSVIASVGVGNAWGEFHTPEIEVVLPRLPREFEGLKIVQVTDVHIGPTLNGDFTRRIVAQINALKPDIVVNTGDLVDGSVKELGDALAPLGGIESRFGSYFCTGNHEFYSGAEDWIAFLNKHRVRVLQNERVEIRDGNAVLDIAGMHDHRAFPGFEPAIGPIIKRRDQERELIMLAHQPKQIEMSAKAGAGLQLSGHTHGGQLFPFGALVHLAQPYVEGLHKHNDQTQIYVSPGTGYWGPPMRVGTLPEVTQLILTRG